MAKDKYVFKRIEKKYVATATQLQRFLKLCDDFITEDEYPEQTVMSIYLDTPDFLLIRNSIEAKKFKEKIRLRSYGATNPGDKVFLEIKRKVNGVVYKRRLSLSIFDAERYIYQGIMPSDSQIMREIESFMNFYGHPKPKMFIACERKSYIGKENSRLRITIDKNIRYRTEDLSFSKGHSGQPILKDDECVMEIKCSGAMELWLVRILDECNIYPRSFSKYAKAHIKQITQ